MDETSTVTHFYFIISSDANSLRQPERCEKVEIGEDGSWYDDTTVQFFSGLNLNRSNFFRPPEMTDNFKIWNSNPTNDTLNNC